MNANAAPKAAPSRLASSRLKNPKLWNTTLPVHSVTASAKPTPQPAHTHTKGAAPSLHLPIKTVKALPYFGVSLLFFLGLLFMVQPSDIQNIPFPDWYGPFHLLSFMTLSSFLYLATTKLKTSLTLAAVLQTLFFFKLQHVEVTLIVLLLTLILFGTIGLSAHIFQILTSKHQRTASRPTLHTLN
jgi:hypothetical protein